MYFNLGDSTVFVHNDQYEMIRLEIDCLTRKIFFITVQSNTIDSLELTSKDHSIAFTFQKQTVPTNNIIDDFNG